ncbi:hypothetical protein, partial [Paenibacillus helianthi]|uniref:hypothetical protein n=1 Tax=Paenibacillus helianthi TaxID=1349432 RepID=UPI001ABF54C1
ITGGTRWNFSTLTLSNQPSRTLKWNVSTYIDENCPNPPFILDLGSLFPPISDFHTWIGELVYLFPLHSLGQRVRLLIVESLSVHPETAPSRLLNIKFILSHSNRTHHAKNVLSF